MPSFLDLDYVLPVSIESIEPNLLVNRALTGKPFFSRADAQFWRVSFLTKPIRKFDSKIREVASHLFRHSIHRPFTVQIPNPLDIKTSIRPPVTTDAVAGANAVVVTLTKKQKLVSGQYVKFSNHNKIYLITSDVSVKSAGDATVNVFPALVKDVPANSLLQSAAGDLSMRVTYAENQSRRLVYPQGGLIQFSFTFDEYLE